MSAPTGEPWRSDPLRMDAYYYGFTPTGVPEIDWVLSAVAVAGKSQHHTEAWSDVREDGTSLEDMIQQAADAAAVSLRRRSRN